MCLFSDVTVHQDSAVYLYVDSHMLLELGKECGKGWVGEMGGDCGGKRCGTGRGRDQGVENKRDLSDRRMSPCGLAVRR